LLRSGSSHYFNALNAYRGTDSKIKSVTLVRNGVVFAAPDKIAVAIKVWEYELSAFLLLVGCAASDKAMLPDDIWMTNGDINTPYKPIAAIEVAKIGFRIFSDIEPTDLDIVLNQMLAEEAKAVGANAVINMTFNSPVVQLCVPYICGFGVSTAKGVAVKTKKKLK